MGRRDGIRGSTFCEAMGHLPSFEVESSFMERLSGGERYWSHTFGLNVPGADQDQSSGYTALDWQLSVGTV